MWKSSGITPGNWQKFTKSNRYVDSAKKKSPGICSSSVTLYTVDRISERLSINVRMARFLVIRYKANGLVLWVFFLVIRQIFGGAQPDMITSQLRNPTFTSTPLLRLRRNLIGLDVEERSRC